MEFSKPELIAVLVALAGTIGALWVIIKAFVKRDQDDLKTCRGMYEEAHKEIKDLHGEYKYLKGRMDGVEQLSLSMLKKLEQRRRTDDDTEDSHIN